MLKNRELNLKKKNHKNFRYSYKTLYDFSTFIFRKKEILPKQRKRDKRSESKNKKHKSHHESPTPDTGTSIINMVLNLHALYKNG